MILSPAMPADMVKDCVSRLNGMLIIGETCTEAAEEALRTLEGSNRPTVCMGSCMKMAVSVMGGSFAGGAPTDTGVFPVHGTRFEAIAGDPGSGAECPEEKAGIPDTMRICAVDSSGAIVAVERREGALFVGVNGLNHNTKETDALLYALVESARI